MSHSPPRGVVSVNAKAAKRVRIMGERKTIAVAGRLGIEAGSGGSRGSDRARPRVVLWLWIFGPADYFGCVRSYSVTPSTVVAV